jgi:tryptophan 2,3-dioxygenase
MSDGEHAQDPQTRKAVTYTSYLKLDELLDLQRIRSGEHDEMLFIIIHQVYELWFKQVLHETGFLQTALEEGDTPKAMAGFRRILTILKTLVGQVDILETMSPRSFLSFRSRLASASGFQSAQFRQFEFLLGQKDRRMIDHHPEGSSGRELIAGALASRTLWDSFLRYLHDTGHPMPEHALNRDVTRRVEADEAVQAAILGIYQTESLATQLCERMVDLDEGLQEWRYRHVKMVERTIGHKPGTGGSEGAEYLRKTLFRALFPDLWAIRTQL